MGGAVFLPFGLARDPWRAQTKPCAHQDPEMPQEIQPDLLVSVQESLVGVWVNSGLMRVQGH